MPISNYCFFSRYMAVRYFLVRGRRPGGLLWAGGRRRLTLGEYSAVGLHARRVHPPVVITALALTLGRGRRGTRAGRLLRRGVEGGPDPHASSVQRDGDRVGKAEVL